MNRRPPRSTRTDNSFPTRRSSDLSSTMNWDRSTDGSVASTAQSMLSVAVHEMGHGLGHTSWVRQTDVGWAVNYVANGATVAFASDSLVTTPTGAGITSLPESARVRPETRRVGQDGVRKLICLGAAYLKKK